MWRNIQKKWQRQSESKIQLDENCQKIHTACRKGEGLLCKKVCPLFRKLCEFSFVEQDIVL